MSENRDCHPGHPATPASAMVPPSQRSRPGTTGAATGIALSCNRCRKALSTTVFVCACDCTFCEECTYNHFTESSNCPVCNKVLLEHDFMELLVADPSATPSSTRTTSFQVLFTKQNAASRALTFQDLCARMLKQHDDCRAGNKFLMKQFLVAISKEGQRSQQMFRAFDGARQENTSLKQAINTQKVRYETALENVQKQLAISNKKLEEKEHQLYQFRKLHDRMTPESPSKGGVRDGARRVSNASDADPRQYQAANQPPPMQGFMIQKEAQERARLRALEAPHERMPVLGHHRNHNTGGPGSQSQHSVNPYSTPRSGGSNGSTSGRIRDLSASSAPFLGGSAAVDNRRRGGMSPSQAFAMQPPGSYSVARGPFNQFQQGGGGTGYSSSRR